MNIEDYFPYYHRKERGPAVVKVCTTYERDGRIQSDIVINTADKVELREKAPSKGVSERVEEIVKILEGREYQVYQMDLNEEPVN